MKAECLFSVNCYSGEPRFATSENNPAILLCQAGGISICLPHIGKFLLNSKHKRHGGRIYHKVFRKKETKPNQQALAFLFWIHIIMIKKATL